MRENFSAITFDVGGTLIECWPSVGHIYAEVAAEAGFDDIDPEKINARFRDGWKKLQNFRHTREQWASLVEVSFKGLIEPLATSLFFPKLYNRFAEPSAWRVFEDVVPTLEALSAQGWKLGIISNWDERLRPLLSSLGLSPFFDSIIISCEVGEWKPQAAIFEAAAESLRVVPHCILHVGDDEESDFRGAKKAGCEAWLLSRQTRGQRPGVIQNLRELTKIKSGAHK